MHIGICYDVNDFVSKQMHSPAHPAACRPYFQHIELLAASLVYFRILVIYFLGLAIATLSLAIVQNAHTVFFFHSKLQNDKQLNANIWDAF